VRAGSVSSIDSDMSPSRARQKDRRGVSPLLKMAVDPMVRDRQVESVVSNSSSLSLNNDASASSSSYAHATFTPISDVATVSRTFHHPRSTAVQPNFNASYTRTRSPRPITKYHDYVDVEPAPPSMLRAVDTEPRRIDLTDGCTDADRSVSRSSPVSVGQNSPDRGVMDLDDFLTDSPDSRTWESDQSAMNAVFDRCPPKPLMNGHHQVQHRLVSCPNRKPSGSAPSRHAEPHAVVDLVHGKVQTPIRGEQIGRRSIVQYGDRSYSVLHHGEHAHVSKTIDLSS